MVSSLAWGHAMRTILHLSLSYGLVITVDAISVLMLLAEDMVYSYKLMLLG